MGSAAHKEFIRVEEARALVLRHAQTLCDEKISLRKAAGYLLSENIYSALSLPPFDNSAMDGFAVRVEEIKNASAGNPVILPVAGIIRAGDSTKKNLAPRTTIRIMTGAPVPEGADAVVMQESVQVKNGNAYFTKRAEKTDHVRFKGEEIKKGEAALKKGALLTPAATGFLSACGTNDVYVYRKPRVSVLVTGSEVVFKGIPRNGKIRDANGTALAAAVLETGSRAHLMHKKDSFREIYAALEKLLQESDVVLIGGGVSVGEYDYVKDVLEKLGVKKSFWKVRQKPGKPLFFGKKGNTLVFGLPGNPFSALCCFYEYVRPALLKMAGQKNLFLAEKQCILKNSVKKKKELCVFMKANVEEKNGKDYVGVEEGQGSHMLKSLATANALLVLPEGREIFRAGETVTTHLLP